MMGFFKRTKERILHLSNSYNYYENQYNNLLNQYNYLLNQNDNQKNHIDFLSKELFKYHSQLNNLMDLINKQNQEYAEHNLSFQKIASQRNEKIDFVISQLNDILNYEKSNENLEKNVNSTIESLRTLSII